MTLTYPMIAWGSPDDISAYTSVNTPTISSAVADPFGGTAAYLVGDDDGASVEYKYKAISFAADGTGLVTFFQKAGTATTSDTRLYDNTAATARAAVRSTWAAGVPTLSLTAGAAQLFTPILVGNGWYLIRYLVSGIVAANANRLWLVGCNTSGASTGNTNYYVRNVALLHYPDNVNPWEDPRMGSSQVQGLSGVEDASTTGTDYRLDFDGCWIPPLDLDDPPISGYAGANESAGINCGVAAMIRAGRDKQVLALVKDRTNPTTTARNAYLASPMTGAPGLEKNAFQRFSLSFRAASPYQPFAGVWP